MSLFLVQHGRSLPKEADPERGLTEEGIAEVEAVAAQAASHGIQVSSIKHSGKKRARQTAELMASALRPPAGVSEMAGLDPMDDVVPVAREVGAEEDLMLVGHLPFMERLASQLVTGKAERPVFKFQNGGIVCLERYPDMGYWVVKWAILPRID